jgi:hypothetical protein
MDLELIAPVAVFGLVLAGVFAGIKRHAAWQAERDQAMRDWAGRNNFRCEIRPAPDVRVRVAGNEEVDFVLEVRTPNEKRTGDKPGTEWASRDVTAEQLELIVVS